MSNNKTNKSLMTKYSNWLFENDSKHNFEKNVMNEGVMDTLLNFGQAGIAFIGSLPPLEATGIAEIADTANAIIFAARGDFVNCFFSLISIAPVIGDAFGKSGMVLRFLERIRSSGGQAGKVASWTIENLPNLKPALEEVKTFVSENKDQIKSAFEEAGKIYRERSTRTQQTQPQALAESDSSEEPRFSGYVQDIYEFIINTPGLGRYFAESEFLNGMLRAIDDVDELFGSLLSSLENAEENIEASNLSNSNLNEGILTENRFKKLAGILR